VTLVWQNVGKSSEDKDSFPTNDGNRNGSKARCAMCSNHSQSNTSMDVISLNAIRTHLKCILAEVDAACFKLAETELAAPVMEIPPAVVKSKKRARQATSREDDGGEPANKKPYFAPDFTPRQMLDQMKLQEPHLDEDEDAAVRRLCARVQRNIRHGYLGTSYRRADDDSPLFTEDVVEKVVKLLRKNDFCATWNRSYIHVDLRRRGVVEPDRVI
jgi:hypothetical protein